MIRNTVTVTALAIAIGFSLTHPSAAQTAPPDWTNGPNCLDHGKRPFPTTEFERKRLVRLLDVISSEIAVDILWPKVGENAWATSCHVPVVKLPDLDGENCQPTSEISGGEWLSVRKVGDAYRALLIDGPKTRLIPLEVKKNAAGTHEMWLQSAEGPAQRYSIHFTDEQVGSQHVKRYIVEAYAASDDECMKNFPIEDLICKPGSTRPACQGRSALNGILEPLQGSAGGGYEPPDKPPLTD